MFNEPVNVLPAPVRACQPSAICDILSPTGFIGKIDCIPGSILLRIGIEIVIDVNAVDVVFAKNVQDHSQRKFLDLALARVHPQKLAIFSDEFGMRATDVVRGNGRNGFEVARAKGIEPGVQLQSAFVRLGNRERKRIIKRRGRLAHSAREVFRPGFERRRVQCVTGRAHLKNNRIEFQVGRGIENLDELGLLLLDGQSRL